MTGQRCLKQCSTSSVAALSVVWPQAFAYNIGSETDKACTELYVLLKGCAMLFQSRSAAVLLSGKGYCSIFYGVLVGHVSAVLERICYSSNRNLS